MALLVQPPDPMLVKQWMTMSSLNVGAISIGVYRSHKRHIDSFPQD